jgi:hypothetical protein
MTRTRKLGPDLTVKLFEDASGGWGSVKIPCQELGARRGGPLPVRGITFRDIFTHLPVAVLFKEGNKVTSHKLS